MLRRLTLGNQIMIDFRRSHIGILHHQFDLSYPYLYTNFCGDPVLAHCNLFSHTEPHILVGPAASAFTEAADTII